VLSIGTIKMGKENPSTRRNSYALAPLFTTNSPLTVMESNPSLRGKCLLYRNEFLVEGF
jgi:hypothetical protein